MVRYGHYCHTGPTFRYYIVHDNHAIHTFSHPSTHSNAIWCMYITLIEAFFNKVMDCVVYYDSLTFQALILLNVPSISKEVSETLT